MQVQRLRQLNFPGLRGCVLPRQEIGSAWSKRYFTSRILPSSSWTSIASSRGKPEQQYTKQSSVLSSPSSWSGSTQPQSSPFTYPFSSISTRRYSTGASDGSEDSVIEDSFPVGETDQSPEEALEAAISKLRGVAPEPISYPPDSWYHAPVHVIQNFLETTHEMTGLPWYVVIMCTAATLRISMLPLNYLAVKNSAIMQKVAPEIKALRAKFEARSRALTDTADKMALNRELKQEMNAIFKKNNTSPFRSFLPNLAQAPFFIAFFFTLRRMSQRNEEFLEGGTLWFDNIAIPDQYYIFPCLTSLAFLATIEVNLYFARKYGTNPSRVQRVLTNFMRVLGLCMLPITSQMPVAVHLYWAMSNSVSIFQIILWRIPAVRKILGLPENAGIMGSMDSVKKDEIKKEDILSNKPQRTWKK